MYVLYCTHTEISHKIFENIKQFNLFDVKRCSFLREIFSFESTLRIVDTSAYTRDSARENDLAKNL